MIASRKVRSAVLLAVALAAMAGVATRLEMKSLNGPRPGFDVRTLHFSEQSFVEAAFEGVETNQVPGVRIRTPQCSQPIFVVPLELGSIAQPQMADGLYGRPPAYRSDDVFSGKIWQNFGPVSRLTSYLGARLFRGRKTSDIDVFIRIYSPSNCAIGPEALRRWAETILNLGSDAAPSEVNG